MLLSYVSIFASDVIFFWTQVHHFEDMLDAFQNNSSLPLCCSIILNDKPNSTKILNFFYKNFEIFRYSSAWILDKQCSNWQFFWFYKAVEDSSRCDHRAVEYNWPYRFLEKSWADIVSLVEKHRQNAHTGFSLEDLGSTRLLRVLALLYLNLWNLNHSLH